MTTLRGSVFDRVEVWGQPWHGRMNQAGVLDLGGGKSKTSTSIPIGGQAQLIQFAGLPVPVDRDCDTAEGASWKNWAILAGGRRQYTPLGNYRFESNSWLYRTSDNTVWCLQLFCSDAADPVVIRARNVNGNGMWQTVYTGLQTFKYDIIDMTRAQRSALSASKTGDRALIHLEQLYTAVISITGNPNWIGPYAIHSRPVNAAFVEISVSGGSASVPPVVSVSELAPADVFVRQSYSAYSSATVKDRAKWLVGAWMRPDSTIATAYIDIEITRTLTGDGSTWSALIGAAVAAKMVFTNEEVPILSISSSATVSSSGGYLSTTTMTTPPGASSSVQASFSIAHKASEDGSVQLIDVNGAGRAFGLLGQQVNPISTNDFSSVWCQHPISGELTVGGHFF